MEQGEPERDADQPTRPPTRGTSSTSRPRLSTKPPNRWRRRLLVAGAVVQAIVLVLVIATGITYWRLTATATNFPGSHFNRGLNAVWLEHTWAGDLHSSADYASLAATLRAEQIGDIYVHVGPLDSDGTIPADRAPYASTFAAAMHVRMPGVKVLAWIGQLEAASGYPADQTVNLAEYKVRTRIANTARQFVLGGMDGVHYDIEPIVNNNPRFLDLLDETRAVLPAGALLSLSAQKWAPNAHIAEWAFKLGKADSWWTSYYYSQVAAHADQLVVEAYNTAMPAPALYELAVKEETQHILEAAQTASHPPQVLIGLPTYSGNTTWFHDSAENMLTGLKGVTAGLNCGEDISHFQGVAIYRYGTTTPNDWTTYDHLWLGR
jgi:hypothetical protein